MLTLYHHPRTRSSRFIFLLEELGVPYEIHRIANIRRPDGSGGIDPENPHPHGKSPALKDGETVVWESAAIALYLTDKYPQNGIGPVIGDPLRGAYLSWLAYYAGVMEPAWMSQYMKWDIPRGTAGWVPVSEVMELVNATLAKGPYLLGENFSAVDILIATTFKMFLGSPLLEKTDLLEGYVNRVMSRPAFARAQAKEMADLINLRNARKQKAKADKTKTAQANRVLHGTPKALRKLTDAQKDQADQRLSAHKLEKDRDDN